MSGNHPDRDESYPGPEVPADDTSAQARPAEEDAANAPPEADEPYDGRTRIGWWRGLLVVILVLGVWALVDYRRRSAYTITWSKDLPACLERARAENLPVILLVYKKNCELTEIKEADVFSTFAVYEWAQGGIPCRLVWSEHPDIVAKYDIVESPTLLVLNPEGELVFRWDGEAITVAIRKRFLKYAIGHEDEATFRRDEDGGSGDSRSKSPPGGRR